MESSISESEYMLTDQLKMCMLFRVSRISKNGNGMALWMARQCRKLEVSAEAAQLYLTPALVEDDLGPSGKLVYLWTIPYKWRF